MRNENVHDVKHNQKQPLSELKIPQSVKLVAKDDAIVTGRKINAKNISCRILESLF